MNKRIQITVSILDYQVKLIVFLCFIYDTHKQVQNKLKHIKILDIQGLFSSWWSWRELNSRPNTSKLKSLQA